MSSYLPTDQELVYQQLLQQLQDLNNKINLFVNGNDSTLIPVASGTIKSLAGIQKAALTNRFVQTIIDMKTRQDILNNISFYNVGNLFRVWGETDPTFNGIYKIDTPSTILKISYADAYDLKEYLPNPWNYDTIKFDETVSNQPFLIAKITQPVQTIKVSLDEFIVDYSYVVDTNAKYAAYHSVVGVPVKVSARDTTEYFSDVNNSGSYSVSHFYSTLTYPKTPIITVVHSINVNEHVFQIYFNPPVDGNGVTVAGHGSLNIRNVDKTNVALTKYLI